MLHNMDTIIERIKKFNAPLLPDKVQLKYKAMTESPFRFFRGTCHLFYEDFQDHYFLKMVSIKKHFFCI
ncbi:DUF2252 family protein [Mucilaginibacter sp. NFX135]|uniref:DUF2252 family protein n=1 Tax=Mucilaginibacter sp. NFX135 TaxID=3402687 RepID=UPI003AFA246E